MLKYALACTTLLAAGFGCGPTYIVRTSTPAPTLYGRVSVEVTDRRDPKHGGADPSQIGIERGSWGIPSPVRIGAPLALELHDLLADAASSTGIGVLPLGQNAGATSRLMVEIQDFWCDGYPPVFKSRAVASAAILDGMTGQVRVPGQPLMAERDAGNCHAALRRTMDALRTAAVAMFANPQLHAALINEPAAPPGPSGPDAPPPPPAPGVPPAAPAAGQPSQPAAGAQQ